MNWKTILAVVIVVAGILVIGFWIDRARPETVAPARATVELPEGYVAASQGWQREWQEHQALEKQIAEAEKAVAELRQVRRLQALRDQFNGLAARLSQAQPCFYRWDAEQDGFRPIPVTLERRSQCVGEQPPAASVKLSQPAPEK
jgi:hypothetical protein